MRGRRLYLAIFIVVLAPIAAAVVITILLLFGVEPRLVFAPGHAVKSLLVHLGFHAVNAVGVVVTEAAWWAVIVAAGLIWERRRAA